MIMDMMRDLTLLLPTVTALIVAVLALVAEMLGKSRISLLIVVVGLLSATGMTVPLIGQDTSIFMQTYRIDALSIGAHLILLPATALTALLLRTETKGTIREGTLYPLLVFATLGAIVLAGAGDMMFLALGLLLSSIASFGLVGFFQTDRSTEAAMKFFVYGSVTGAVMLFGLTYWYGAVGSTYLADLSRLDAMPLAGLAGLVGVIIGIGYKAGVVPVHFWVPDSYQGAPISVAAYLSVVPKIGALFAFAQIFRDMPESMAWQLTAAIIAAATMTYGTIVALMQTNVVRLLAYSAIAQSGFFLLAIVSMPDQLAIQSLLYFAAAYAVISIGAFATVMMIGTETSDYKDLLQKKPVIAIGMIILLLSLVGIPPFAGFFGKLLLFTAAIDSGFAWLAVIAIVNSVLSLVAYLRIILPMMQPSNRKEAHHIRQNAIVISCWWIAIAANILLAIAAQYVVSIGNIYQ
jgi:proton-translocating NADH-quinone oxidoreductase chain N